MLELLKADANIGSALKVYLISGESIDGILEEIGDNYILINENGKKKRFFAPMIGGWDVCDNGQKSNITRIKDTDNLTSESINTSSSSISAARGVFLRILNSIGASLTDEIPRNATCHDESGKLYLISEDGSFKIPYNSKRSIGDNGDPSSFSFCHVIGWEKYSSFIFCKTYEDLLNAFLESVENSNITSLRIVRNYFKALVTDIAQYQELRDLCASISNKKKNPVVKLKSLSAFEKKVVTEFVVKAIVENPNISDEDLHYLLIEEYNINLDPKDAHKFIKRHKKNVTEKKASREPSVESSPKVKSNAGVYKYFSNFNNGAARSADAGEIRFTDDVVVNGELLSEIKRHNYWDKNATELPVVISSHIERGKTIADFVAAPATVAEYASWIAKLRQDGRNDLADKLSVYLSMMGHNINDDAVVLSDEEKNQLAHKLQLVKDFDKAEALYLELIEKGFQLDTTVKNLTTIYQEQKDVPKAIDLMLKYLGDFDKKPKAYNWLATLYASIGRKKDAVKVLEESKQFYPETPSGQKQKARVDKQINFVKKQKSKTNDLSGIVSSFLVSDLENPSSATILFDEKSGIDKLHYLNERLGLLKNSYDAPNYYAAKVNYLIDSGDTSSSELKKTLQGFCKSKARNYFANGIHDSAFEYLKEGYLVDNGQNFGLFNLMVLSLCALDTPIISLFDNAFESSKEILCHYRLMHTVYVYNRVLEIIALDDRNSRALVKALYFSEEKEWLCGMLQIENHSAELFVNTLLTRANELTEAYKLNNNEISVATRAAEFEEIYPLIQDVAIDYCCQADSGLIKDIKSICNNFNDGLSTKGYDNKYAKFVQVSEMITSSESKIASSPTAFGRNVILPILTKIKMMLQNQIDLIKSEHAPNLTIKSLREATKVGNQIEIQLEVNNSPDCTKATNIVIILNKINGTAVPDGKYKFSSSKSLSGNEADTFSFQIDEFNDEDEEINLLLAVLCEDSNYKAITKLKDVVVKIDYGDFYEPIKNLYSYGGAVEGDMFFGRDMLINEICDYVCNQSIGVVLYGQKRSGKSSVLVNIANKLRNEKKSFAAYLTLGMNIVKDSKADEDCSRNLYYHILKAIELSILEYDEDSYDNCVDQVLLSEFKEEPEIIFTEKIEKLKRVIKKDLNFQTDRIVLVIDEFTYLYYHILNKNISPETMTFWKGLIESKYFSVIMAGQDSMPRFMKAYDNVFASMHIEEPLSYLDKASATDLIVKPVFDKEMNRSRYSSDAVNKIYDLTAGSAFYIQILCSELVKAVNMKHSRSISLKDVNDVTDNLINREGVLNKKNFENLVSCGDPKFDVINQDDAYHFLRCIAVETTNTSYVSKEAILKSFVDKFHCPIGMAETIENELYSRGVICYNPAISETQLKIKVELFKLWLIKHEHYN